MKKLKALFDPTRLWFMCLHPHEYRQIQRRLRAIR